MRARTSALAAALVALVLLPGPARGEDPTGNPVIEDPAAGSTHYAGFNGPFVVDFESQGAPAATYTYAVFRDDPTTGAAKLVAGPATYTWTGVGAKPHLLVTKLAAAAHLRFKITDHAGHEAQVAFVVKPGPAPRCSLVLPTAVHVNAPVQKVTGRLSSTCAALGTRTADWKVTRSGQVLDYFRFDRTTTDTWTLYDSDPTGTYGVLPLSARDDENGAVPQNKPTPVVRRDAHANLTVSRSGGAATIRVGVTKYEAAANGFRAWPGKPVALAYRTCSTCRWISLRTLVTDGSGKASTSVTAPVRSYRVTVGGTSSIWQAQDYNRG